VLHIPDVVVRELLADPVLGATDIAVYCVAWAGLRESMSELARWARIARSTAAQSCARLAPAAG